MGKTPCCDRQGLKKGAWTEEEDHKLLSYVRQHGEGGWRSLPQKAGLLRCGKSCRLRWANYLRPGIKRGEFTPEEEQTIIQLHAILGNRWSTIARHLYKRTDNEIKNYWNTRLKRRVAEMSSTSSSSTSTTRTTMDPHHLVPDHDQTSMIINFPTTTDHDQERERSTSAEDVHHKKSPGATSSSTNSTHNVNKVAKPTSTHSLTTFATTLTQTTSSHPFQKKKTTSSHYGPTTSTNTTSSTTFSEFDQVSKYSSSSSSARILNKIASKLTLLNLPRVVVNGGGGLTCDSRVDGSARGSSSVREISPCGGYNSGSPGSASTPISSVDPNFEDFSPPAPILSRESGFSTYSGDQSICEKGMELDLLEELLSETDAYNIAEDVKKDDDDVDDDLEQMLVTSFPLISSDYDQ